MKLPEVAFWHMRLFGRSWTGPPAIAYTRERALANHVIDRLLEHPARRFADQAV